MSNDRDAINALLVFSQSPLSEAAIQDAVEAVRREGDKAWESIEALAGLLAPRVRAEVLRRL